MSLSYLNDDNFKSNIDNSKGVILVDFFATWCGPCRMLTPVLEQVQEEMSDSVKIFKVDVDEAEKTAKNFGIMSVPSVVIFKDGIEIDRLVGFRLKEQIVDYLRSIL